jgi:hypothetical protein
MMRSYARPEGSRLVSNRDVRGNDVTQCEDVQQSDQ